MTEAAASNATETLPVGAVKNKPGVTVVTAANFDAFADQALGVKPAQVEEGSDADNDPEAEGAAELAKLETEKATRKAKADAEANAPKEGDVDGSNVYFKGKWVDKHNFNYRLHLKAEEHRKEAQAKVDAAAKEAKDAREALAKAKQEAEELKAKYEPPKSETLGAKPARGQFATDADYETALIDWSATKTRQEDAAKASEAAVKAENDRVVKAWSENLAKFKAETPDFDEKLAANKDLPVSDQLQAEILRSEYGPQIFYHLLDNPDIARELQAMKVAQMIKKIGRLEEKFAVGVLKDNDVSRETVPAKEKTAAGLAEISKAKAPISPLKGGNSIPQQTSEAIAKIADPTERHRRFVEARRAGKIGN
jgi:hypothetical protein